MASHPRRGDMCDHAVGHAYDSTVEHHGAAALQRRSRWVRNGHAPYGCG